MGDLRAAETFQDSVYIADTVTGAPLLGSVAVTCTILRISNNAQAVGVVQEVGLGVYRVTNFTPLVAEAFMTIWGAPAGNTVYGNYKIFKVGGGSIADIVTLFDAAITTRAPSATALSTATWTNIRAGYLDELDFDLDARLGAPAGASISADILVIDNFVDDLETRLTAARAGYLDNLSAGAVAQAGTALSTATWTGARAAAIDELLAANLPTDIANLNTDLGDWSARPNLSSLLASLGIPDVAGKDLYTCLITDRLDNATYGLSALETLVDGIEARTNNNEITKAFFSATDDLITCNTDSSDLTLPSVVLPNIAGTITHVYAGLSFRMIENTNAGTNGLNGAQDVQVKEDAAGAYTDAINLVDNQWLLAASTREGGYAVFGNIDIVAQVAAFNKTYDFIIDNNDVDQANLNLCDVQTFLIVSYY